MDDNRKIHKLGNRLNENLQPDKENFNSKVFFLKEKKKNDTVIPENYKTGKLGKF